MKISFWTSTEYSGFMAGLIRELRELGASANQRYQIAEESYRSAKSLPARLFLRLRQYIVYPLQFTCILAWKRIKVVCVRFSRDSLSSCDFCVVSTNTFYVPLIATFLRPNVVHLIYDLFPEAMIHSGKWKEGTLKVKLVRWVTKLALKRSGINVFLGERLKNYVESIHGVIPNSAIVAVGADQTLFRHSPKERSETSRLYALSKELELEREQCSNSGLELPSLKAPKVLYCGNFGNMHDSATLFQYWKKVAKNTECGLAGDQLSGGDWPRLRWTFHCSGPKRVALEAELAQLPEDLSDQIALGDGLDQKAWIDAMESADVALVTMSPGSETVVMPSKTYSAMMAGQAILAIAPENSDLVDLIKAVDCGWWVEPGDVDGFADAVRLIASDTKELLEKQERAYVYAHQNFGQDALAKQWIQLLETL